MSSLNAFLHPINIGEREAVISARFLENDKPVAWRLRPVTQEENADIIKKNTRRNKKGDQEFDRIGYAQDLVVAGVVFPDLNSTELQKAYGVIGAAKLVSKMLFVGEYGKLSQEVQKISGLDNDINEDKEEAKN